MKKYEEVDLINSAALKRESPQAEDHSLYEAVHTDLGYVDWCLKRYLGRIRKCETVEELDSVRDGVTPDCYSYRQLLFSVICAAGDYTKGACIGTRISKARLTELAGRSQGSRRSLIRERQTEASLKEAQKYESLNQETGQILRLASASDELEGYYNKQEQLQKELKELEDGTQNGRTESGAGEAGGIRVGEGRGRPGRSRKSRSVSVEWCRQRNGR